MPPDTCPKCGTALPSLQQWVTSQTVVCAGCSCTVAMSLLAGPKVLWDPTFAEKHEWQRKGGNAPTFT